MYKIQKCQNDNWKDKSGRFEQEWMALRRALADAATEDIRVINEDDGSVVATFVKEK